MILFRPLWIQPCGWDVLRRMFVVLCLWFAAKRRTDDSQTGNSTYFPLRWAPCTSTVSLLERAATTLIRAWNGDSSLTKCSFNLSHPLSSLSTRPLCLSLLLLKRHLSLSKRTPHSHSLTISHDNSLSLSLPPPLSLSKWHLSEKNLYKSPSFPAFWIQCRHTHGLIHRSMLVTDQLYGCAASISTILTFMLSACITMQKSSTQKVRVKYHIGEGPVWVSTIIPYSVVA